MIKHNRKDDDGHKFLVPEDLLSRFDELLDKLLSTKRFTQEYYDLEADFCNEFQQYMVG